MKLRIGECHVRLPQFASLEGLSSAYAVTRGSGVTQERLCNVSVALDVAAGGKQLRGFRLQDKERTDIYINVINVNIAEESKIWSVT